MIGPALVLAVLLGIFSTALYVLIRGSAGGRLPLLLLAAILGAWAGDSLGARLGIDLLRLGDFHVLAAFIGSWIGIGLVAVVAALGPAGSDRNVRALAAIGVARRRSRSATRLGALAPRSDATGARTASATRTDSAGVPPMLGDRTRMRVARGATRRAAETSSRGDEASSPRRSRYGCAAAADTRGRPARWRRRGHEECRAAPRRRRARVSERTVTDRCRGTPDVTTDPADPGRCPPPRSGGASSSSSTSAATRPSRRPASSRPATRPSSSRTRGMVQFKDVLTGAEKRSYNRAVDYQRCLRVAGKHNDFEEVGRTPRHHTLFEMLGNWSFGDYFKREAIHWAWDFLTQDLGIPADRLAATTYKDDEVAWDIWRDEIGLPPERMAALGRRRRAATTRTSGGWPTPGPCGPCSEIHFDRGAHLSEGPDCIPDHSRDTARAGSRSGTSCSWSSTSAPTAAYPLPFTERRHRAWASSGWRASSSRSPSNYDTDLFAPIHARMRELLGHDPDAFEAGAVQLPGHRRPLAGDHVPDRRRRPAVERGPRLRPPPDPPPRGPPRPAARAARAVPRRDGRGRHRHHGRGLSAPRRAARRDPRRDRARGGPVRADARRRHGPARGGARSR